MDILRESEYPHQALVCSTYERFKRINDELDKRRGGPTLSACWRHKLRVAEIAWHFQGKEYDPITRRMTTNLGTRKLLKAPCEEFGVDYEQLMRDFDTLQSVMPCETEN